MLSFPRFTVTAYTITASTHSDSYLDICILSSLVLVLSVQLSLSQKSISANPNDLLLLTCLVIVRAVKARSYSCPYNYSKCKSTLAKGTCYFVFIKHSLLILLVLLLAVDDDVLKRSVVLLAKEFVGLV